MKTEIRPENEMKDSGVEWIGYVPKDWNITKLGNLGKIQTGNTPDKSNSKYYSNENGVLWVKAENLGTIYSIEETAEYITEAGVSLARVFNENTVFVCCIASIGKCGYSNKKSSCNQQINGISFDKLFWKYGLYMTMAQEEEYLVCANGNVVKILNTNKQQMIKCPVPTLSEQHDIADYLDEVCSKIDEIIAEAKASIEEYKELKQAVIVEAVTKGLYKNVEVKETGEKWLHSIPKHWRMEKGKKLLFETNYRSVDGQEELLTVSQYTGITPRSKKNVTMFQAESLVDYKICEAGDIAANTMWMWAGAVGVSRYRGIISPSYNTYRQKRNDYNSDYLDYLLRIAPLVDEYASLSTGIRASRLRLYPTQFLSINYPVPPLVEQMAIVDWLNEQLPKYDSLITEKEALIADLEAYKKSLIYELVTGKRRVV